MAEADHLQRLRTGEMLHPGGEVDVQVLVRIVVIHADGDFKVHAADGIHQRGEAVQIYGYRKIHWDAQLLGDGLGQQSGPAGVIGEVDLVVLSIDDGLGVPWDADTIDVVVLRIHSHQDIGVAAAIVVIHAGHQNGVEIGLALQMGRLGQGFCVLGGVFGGDLLRFVGPGGFGGDLRGTEETEVAGIQCGGHKDHEKQQSAPAAPSPAGSLCHIQNAPYSRGGAAGVSLEKLGEKIYIILVATL